MIDQKECQKKLLGSQPVKRLLIIDFDEVMAIDPTCQSSNFGLSSLEREKFTEAQITENIQKNIKFPALWQAIIERHQENGDMVAICCAHEGRIGKGFELTGAEFIGLCLKLGLPELPQEALNKIEILAYLPENEESENFGKNNFILSLIKKFNDRYPDQRIDTDQDAHLKRVSFVSSIQKFVQRATHLGCNGIWVEDLISAIKEDSTKKKLKAEWPGLSKVRMCLTYSNLEKYLISQLGYSKENAESHDKILQEKLKLRKTLKENLEENLSFKQLTVKNELYVRKYLIAQKKAREKIQFFSKRAKLVEPSDHFNKLIQWVGLTPKDLTDIFNKTGIHLALESTENKSLVETKEPERVFSTQMKLLDEEFNHFLSFIDRFKVGTETLPPQQIDENKVKNQKKSGH